LNLYLIWKATNQYLLEILIIEILRIHNEKYQCQIGWRNLEIIWKSISCYIRISFSWDICNDIRADSYNYPYFPHNFAEYDSCKIRKITINSHLESVYTSFISLRLGWMWLDVLMGDDNLHWIDW
jgi:hypothetical protein